MKSQRKVDRDRAKREAARHRTRPPTDMDGSDEPSDDLDDEVSRSLLGYDE